MKREVAEKTLEINVCAEILQNVRALPGCGSAVWIGMKQDQEFRNGLDGLLRGAPGLCLMLQFKAPLPDPPDAMPYRFSIGGKQLTCLRRLARLHPHAVHYAFPYFNTLSTLGAAAPNLLNDTWLLRVADVPPGGHHRIEGRRGVARIFSEETEAKLGNWESFSARWAGLSREFVPADKIAGWLHEIVSEFKGPDAGQIFRGMKALYIPR